MLRYTETHDLEYIQKNLGDICASLEDAIVDSLVTKTINALKKTKMKTLVMGGGVSANAWLRTRLQDYCDKHGIRFCIPDRSLSTDNGAMIAAAAIRRQKQGMLKSIDTVKPWMPLAI